MKKLEKISRLTKPYIRKFNDELFSLIKSDDAFLNRILEYVFSDTGKQVRVHLVFLSALMFGKVNRKTHIAAALVQLLHTSTLIHDDVVDKAVVRRGKKTVNAEWNNKVAVLVGDYLFSKALEIAINEKLYDVLQILTPTISQMSMGEIIQLNEIEKKQYSEQVYMDIIFRKTAVLISASAQSGANSTGASQQQQMSMKQFGNEAGMAFQIQDDILDFTANHSFGKVNGKDLEEKKYTLPLIYALDKAPKKESAKVMKTIDNGVNKKYKQQIMEFIEAYKGFDYAQQVMDNHVSKAHDILKTLPENEANDVLYDLIVYFTKRKK
ncbi:MAG: polyprenyl synthetase family protein [Bacteroidota bacterium]|nr:polyprenyl synthetase family protein [Bacteroidota bacterium]